MYGAEGVGYVQLRHGGQLLGELGVVLLLAGVEAQVFQQHDLAALQRRGLGLGVLAHNVLGEDDLLPQQLAETLCHGGEAQLAFPLALGLTQMGAGDDRRLLFQQVADGGQRRHDALVAGNGAGLLVLGHVEIAAQQDLFPSHVHVQNGLFIVVHTDTSPFEIVCVWKKQISAPPSRPARTARGTRSAAGPRRSGWPRSC